MSVKTRKNVPASLIPFSFEWIVIAFDRVNRILRGAQPEPKAQAAYHQFVSAA